MNFETRKKKEVNIYFSIYYLQIKQFASLANIDLFFSTPKTVIFKTITYRITVIDIDAKFFLFNKTLNFFQTKATFTYQYKRCYLLGQ